MFGVTFSEVSLVYRVRTKKWTPTSQIHPLLDPVYSIFSPLVLSPDIKQVVYDLFCQKFQRLLQKMVKNGVNLSGKGVHFLFAPCRWQSGIEPKKVYAPIGPSWKSLLLKYAMKKRLIKDHIPRVKSVYSKLFQLYKIVPKSPFTHSLCTKRLS